MLKSFDKNINGKSLIEVYAHQVVRSQFKRRADVAVIDRHICSKNIIELKSYFVSSLVTRLTPDIEKAISWAEGVRAAAVSGGQVGHGIQDLSGAEEVMDTLQSMKTFLSEIQGFAQLEAGICSDMPETLELNEIIIQAQKNVSALKEFGSNEISLSLLSDPLAVLGYRSKLIQSFSNIFDLAANKCRAGTEILVSVEKSSELDIAIITQYSGVELSEAEIRRSLATTNLVEQIIALGAGNEKLVLPIASALIQLHSGEVLVQNRDKDVVEIRVTLPIFNDTTPALLSQ